MRRSDRDDHGIWARLAATLLASALGHVLGWAVLSWAPSRAEAVAALAVVDVAVLDAQLAPPPDPPPEAPPEPPPVPPPVPPTRRVRRRPVVVQPEPEPPPPPAEETPVAFDGLVLTNEGAAGAGWAVRQASGEDRHGPIGPPGIPTGQRRRGVLGGSARGRAKGPPRPRVVAPEDLSRRPVPPAGLARVLERNYPSRARRQGIEGVARVRVRIGPNGSVRVLSTLSESWEGFGEACARTVRQAGHWRPPLAEGGHPVATVVRFRCTFEMRY